VLLERHGGTEVGAQASVAVVVDLRPRWPVLEDLKEREREKGEKRRNGRENYMEDNSPRSAPGMCVSACDCIII
jgi:hypothetical protein